MYITSGNGAKRLKYKSRSFSFFDDSDVDAILAFASMNINNVLLFPFNGCLIPMFYPSSDCLQYFFRELCIYTLISMLPNANVSSKLFVIQEPAESFQEIKRRYGIFALHFHSQYSIKKIADSSVAFVNDFHIMMDEMLQHYCKRNMFIERYGDQAASVLPCDEFDRCYREEEGEANQEANHVVVSLSCIESSPVVITCVVSVAGERRRAFLQYILHCFQGAMEVHDVVEDVPLSIVKGAFHHKRFSSAENMNAKLVDCINVGKSISELMKQDLNDGLGDSATTMTGSFGSATLRMDESLSTCYYEVIIKCLDENYTMNSEDVGCTKIKASVLQNEIQEDVSREFKIKDVVRFKTELKKGLLEKGLTRRRMNDGVYYFGISRKSIKN
jgi:hypothetical protein